MVISDDFEYLIAFVVSSDIILYKCKHFSCGKLMFFTLKIYLIYCSISGFNFSQNSVKLSIKFPELILGAYKLFSKYL